MESYRRPAIFVFVMPLVLMRAGMMVGNWGQHAFVDADEPDSDYRSSVTLIDVQVSERLLLSVHTQRVARMANMPMILTDAC